MYVDVVSSERPCRLCLPPAQHQSVIIVFNMFSLVSSGLSRGVKVATCALGGQVRLGQASGGGCPRTTRSRARCVNDARLPRAFTYGFSSCQTRRQVNPTKTRARHGTRTLLFTRPRRDLQRIPINVAGTRHDRAVAGLWEGGC